MLNTKLTLTKHLKGILVSVIIIAKAIGRLMLNVKGPSETSRQHSVERIILCLTNWTQFEIKFQVTVRH